jgi:DNA-binding NarL/FixJ family response regulator
MLKKRVHPIHTKDHLVPELTPRQKQILHFIVQGFTNREMAQQLRISVQTVEVHRLHLMRRLKVRNVAQLIRQALQYRFIPKNYPAMTRF